MTGCPPCCQPYIVTSDELGTSTTGNNKLTCIDMMLLVHHENLMRILYFQRCQVAGVNSSVVLRMSGRGAPTRGRGVVRGARGESFLFNL